MKRFLFSALLLGALQYTNAQYCTVAVDCTDGDNITNVEFGGIVNPTACGLNGYSDYTISVAPAEVIAGETYPIAITVGDGWSSESVSLWIDYNNNNSFDEEEFLEIGVGSGSTIISEVEIPSTVPTGTYRMRIAVIASNVVNDDPCYYELDDYGEYEDYLVNVTNMLAVSDITKSKIAIYPNPVNDVFNLKLTDSFDTTKGKITITDITGKIVKTFAVNEVYNVSDLPKGVYVISVTDGDNKFTQKLIKK